MARTLWRHDEQTEGKHLVLRSYLDGWFPILSRWNGRLLFVDGFAGPGEYIGENGARPWSRSTVSDAINRRIGIRASRWCASSSSLMMRGLDICADCWRRNPRSRTPKSGC